MKSTAVKPVTSLYEFCLQHRADADAVGDVCSEVASDHEAPRTDEALREYLLRQFNGDAIIRILWRAYLRAKTTARAMQACERASRQ